jgi:hypothetical protein
VDAVNEDNGNDEDEDEGQEAVVSAEADEQEPEVEAAADGAKLSMKERMEKMKELRGRMVSLRLLFATTEHD